MEGIEWGKPRPDGDRFHLIARGVNGHARVRAEWTVLPNSPSVAPGRVMITRNGRSNADGDRGVTSPVLADAQPLIVAMTRELPEQTKALAGIDPMDDIRAHAARLPAGPRASSTYYRDVQAVYSAIQRLGVRNPVKVLADITGRPESTLKLHLRKAREEADR